MEKALETVKGRIFDIQRFSIHDGPGIRTIVFLKGCKLRCKWCCNPESQNYQIETMNENGKITTVGKDVMVGEVIETILRDRQYYVRSGGGLTLSGGEFLCQPDFSHALLRVAKLNGINTAVETTSFADFKTIEKMLPFIDNYLMDIKHINEVKHKEFTGQSNELILENAQKIAQRAKNMIIRVPVIPTFNDTEEEISAIAKFASSLENVKELHLLPYHRLGQDKYGYLGREYLLKGIEPMKDEKIEALKKAAEKYSLDVEIGG